jgi:hypothetical protein
MMDINRNQASKIIFLIPYPIAYANAKADVDRPRLSCRDTSVREKCVAVLANLSTMKDGRLKIAEAGGIPVLVDQVDVGTPRSKENAAATLLQLAINSSRYTAAMIQASSVVLELERVSSYILLCFLGLTSRKE